MDLFSQIAELVYVPTRWAINLMFLFALFEAGRLIADLALRIYRRNAFDRFRQGGDAVPGLGHPVARLAAHSPDASLEDIEVAALRRLEWVRIGARVAPLLGLIATLVPMGPALVALTENDTHRLAELLRTAFSAVVLSLVAASILFVLATVRRRWCAEEVVAVSRRLGGAS